MPFISVPSKKSYEVDVAQPVQRWITNAYAGAVKPEDTNAANELNKLRNNAVVRALDKNESSLEIIYRYFDQLFAIDSKLPFNQTQIIVPFKWKDAFEKGGIFSKASLTMSSGGYERACVLFNIAALQSQVAAVQSHDHDTELKLCCKLFPQSASIFNHLKENVIGLIGQEATADLMPDTVGALSALMLAQGQESFYLKAAKDQMKSTVVAKIAHQAAEFYGEALKQMNREALRSLWERESLSNVAGKNAGFQGIAHYYQSLVCKEEKEIGPELAHLTKAHEVFSGAAVAQLFPDEATKIQRAYQAAKKDNDFIYHERVPDLKTMPAIGKTPLAKIHPLHPPLSQGFKDLFMHLVPVAVQQALAAYDSRKQGVIAGETGRMREASALMNGILASLNLPAAVEDVCTAEVLPASLKEKATSIRSGGGVGRMRTTVDELPSLLLRNREILDETTRLLSEEKADDERMRTQFKEKWTRMPSERLTEPLWAEIGKYKAILETAKNADEIVRQKMTSHQRGLELLSKPEAELKSAIPLMISGSSGANTAAVSRLKSLLSHVETIKSERAKIEEELKSSAEKVDMTTSFLRALAESGALNEEQISTEKLNDIFSSLREQISRSIQDQEKLMREVQDANVEFVRERGAGSGEREQLLRELAASADTYKELTDNLKEGTKFYNDLTPLLVRLQQKVSDFCFARRTEKEELLKDVQQAIVAAPTADDAKVPPSRPPPPKTTAPTSATASAPSTAASAPGQPAAPYLAYNPGLNYGAPPHQQQYGQYPQQPPQGQYAPAYGNAYATMPYPHASPQMPYGAAAPYQSMPYPSNVGYGNIQQPPNAGYGQQPNMPPAGYGGYPQQAAPYPGQGQPQPPYPVQPQWR